MAEQMNIEKKQIDLEQGNGYSRSIDLRKRLRFGESLI